MTGRHTQASDIGAAEASLIAAVNRAGRLGLFSGALDDAELQIAERLVSLGRLAWRKPGTEGECLVLPPAAGPAQ